MLSWMDWAMFIFSCTCTGNPWKVVLSQFLSIPQPSFEGRHCTVLPVFQAPSLTPPLFSKNYSLWFFLSFLPAGFFLLINKTSDMCHTRKINVNWRSLLLMSQRNLLWNCCLCCYRASTGRNCWQTSSQAEPFPCPHHADMPLPRGLVCPACTSWRQLTCSLQNCYHSVISIRYSKWLLRHTSGFINCVIHLYLLHSWGTVISLCFLLNSHFTLWSRSDTESLSQCCYRKISQINDRTPSKSF